MEIAYTDKAQEDLDYWRKSGNKKVQQKISQLLDSIQESPFEGIGKPERLKHNLSGYASRRITDEHRMLYEVIDERIVIHSLKGHYQP